MKRGREVYQAVWVDHTRALPYINLAMRLDLQTNRAWPTLHDALYDIEKAYEVDDEARS